MQLFKIMLIKFNRNPLTINRELKNQREKGYFPNKLILKVLFHHYFIKNYKIDKMVNLAGFKL
ncbi:hypothetical protein C5467_00910 [Photorhabdus khanii subsp. guanajuatensis]|uniref:Uncharacterized protein n=1 Tax=Photorhabdus khanii subsp. guanajuatensis TaxID=2100166 RepID=A0A4R4K6Q8_9GAMM|nr:hypothetical protein C5467_00910 [Photorhabdus khanii subsp. guanajuatensis]